MKECLLLSHVFVRKFEFEKIRKINFALKHYRKYNPNSYIIVTGHGLKPPNLKNLCDYYYWPEKIINSDINYGHPILVNKGLDHAIEKGFGHILKTRLDSIHLIENLYKFSLESLKNKLYLTSQISTWNQPNLCDLFNFSQTSFMKKCWELENWKCTKYSGLRYHAENFKRACNNYDWNSCLKLNCAIKNIYNLKWIDLRPKTNWNIIKHYENDVMENKLINFREFLWGSKEGWIIWDDNGKLKKSYTWNIKNLVNEYDLINLN